VEQIQKAFIALLDSLYQAAQHYSDEVLLFADPVHQVHNNENDYCWQLRGAAHTKNGTGQHRKKEAQYYRGYQCRKFATHHPAYRRKLLCRSNRSVFRGNKKTIPVSQNHLHCA
jgi:hypothetical protein